MTPLDISLERGITEETTPIALAGIFGLSNTLAFAQTSQGKAGSDNGPTSNAPTTQNQGTAGSAEQNKGTSMPSSKDASTQVANTAGAGEKKGDATSPGGTTKK
jgi:hypothetical protein